MKFVGKPSCGMLELGPYKVAKGCIVSLSHDADLSDDHTIGTLQNDYGIETADLHAERMLLTE